LTTAIRREELCTLTLRHYDGIHIIVEGKGSKQRKLALQPAIANLLNEYLEERNKKYGNTTNALIVSNKGDRYSGDAILKKVKTVLKKAGLSEDRIDAIHTHSLRHTCIANLLSNNVDIYTCSKILGHASLQTSLRYSHLHEGAMDSALQNQRSVI